MGGISVINLVSSARIKLCERWGNLTTTSSSQIYPSSTSVQTSSTSFRRIDQSRLVCYSKPSDFQDFQDYARPARLLSSTEPSIITQSSPFEMFSSFGVDESRSTYIVKLRTSSVSDSCLSDMNAGIMLCLINEKGDSILQRIAASPITEEAVPNMLCFQRGSSDEFIFEGPKLGNIEAVWIGLDSGRWRLGGLCLIIINGCEPQSTHTEEDGKITLGNGLKYDFEAEDIHLGDGTSISMVELRPNRITELSGDLSSLLETGLSQSTSLLNREVSNEESMKEYADLKFSLLLYDAMLIFVGAWITDVSTGETATIAYLTGGAGGFLYLLLLQRSVDGLPASAPASVSTSNTQNFNELIGQLKGPVSSLALAFGFAIAAVKYGSGITSVVLTPKEIIIGMMGFLVCKIAVLLAAFKPVPIRLK